MPQLEQTSVFASLIFWSWVSFLVLLYLLKRYVYPPLIEILEAREKKISGEINEAGKLKEEAQKIKEDFERDLKSAHERANTIVQMSEQEAKKIQEKTLAETERKVKQLQIEAEQDIQVSRNKLLGEIRNYTAALTIASTEKLLSKVIQDKDKERMVEESINEIINELEQKSRS
ncbi:MAG: F0F1 ATP synthase subunit B [Nitrospinales bacterium]